MFLKHSVVSRLPRALDCICIHFFVLTRDIDILILSVRLPRSTIVSNRLNIIMILSSAYGSPITHNFIRH